MVWKEGPAMTRPTRLERTAVRMVWRAPLIRLIQTVHPLPGEQRRLILIFVADLLRTACRAEQARVRRIVRAVKRTNLCLIPSNGPGAFVNACDEIWARLTHGRRR